MVPPKSIIISAVTQMADLTGELLIYRRGEDGKNKWMEREFKFTAKSKTLVYGHAGQKPSTKLKLDGGSLEWHHKKGKTHHQFVVTLSRGTRIFLRGRTATEASTWMSALGSVCDVIETTPLPSKPGPSKPEEAKPAPAKHWISGSRWKRAQAAADGSKRSSATDSTKGKKKKKKRGNRRLPAQTSVKAMLKKTGFDKAELKMLKANFKELAVNGSIDFTAFKELFGTVSGMSIVLIRAVFKFFDANENGLLDETEFLLGMSTILKAPFEEKVEMAYSLYDLNGNGTVSRLELHAIIKNQVVNGMKLVMTMMALENAQAMGEDMSKLDPRQLVADEDLPLNHLDIEPIVEAALERYDLNKDGCLSKSEFTAWAKDEPLVADILNIVGGYVTHAGQYGAAPDAGHVGDGDLDDDDGPVDPTMYMSGSTNSSTAPFAADPEAKARAAARKKKEGGSRSRKGSKSSKGKRGSSAKPMARSGAAGKGKVKGKERSGSALGGETIVGGIIHLSMSVKTTLHKVRKEAGLAGFPLQRLVDLWDELSEDDALTRQGFDKIFSTQAKSHPQLMDSIFRAFDYDDDGLLDFGEFVLGMSILLDGTAEEKIALAFTTFDANEDEKLSKKEVVWLMTNVIVGCLRLFNVSVKKLHLEDPHLVAPEDIDRVHKSVTKDVETAFGKFSDDGDDLIDMVEFKKWVTHDTMFYRFLRLFQVDADPNPQEDCQIM